MFMGRYTTIGLKWHLHPGVVKKSLNANLGISLVFLTSTTFLLILNKDDIMPSVEEEIYHAFDTILPLCESLLSHSPSAQVEAAFN